MINKALLALALYASLAAVTAKAETIVTTPEQCGKVATLARTLMTARQSGYPIERAYAQTAASEVGTWLTKTAYDVPLQATPALRTDISMEFGNWVYRLCIKPATATSPAKPELSV